MTPAGSDPRKQSNAIGILCMALAIFFFASADTAAKFLAATYHPVQITGIRQLGLLFGVILWLILRGTGGLRTKKPGLQVLRGLCATFSATLFVFALRYIPLADAATIAFVAPFWVTILGFVILKEPVGPMRWIAIATGFAGTLVVMRPGFASFHPAYLLVLLSAFLFAARQVISRNLGASETTVATVAFTAGTSVVLLGALQPLVWSPVQPNHIPVFALYACLAAIGEVLVIKSLELALAVVVAPLQYTMILWTSFYGFAIFGNIPDVFTYLGSAIIMLSGGFTLWREHRRWRN